MSRQEVIGPERTYAFPQLWMLKPNPFRDMANYPINEKKIETLLASYERTGFWGNIVGRRINEKEFQIAYGHHRLAALWRKYGERSKQQVGIVVQDLSDADMIRIMADENDEEFRSSAYVQMESVRSVLLAYASGNPGISEQLGEIPSKTKDGCICEAPSVVFDDSQSTGDHPYTRHQVAKFLGWTRKNNSGIQPDFRCDTAFKCLEVVERGLAKETDFIGMTITAAEAVASSALAEHKRKAKEAETIAKQAEERKQLAEQETGRERLRLEKEAASLAQEAKAATKEATKHPAQFIQEAKEDIAKGAGLREIRERSTARSDRTATKSPDAWTKAVEKLCGKLRQRWTDDDKLYESVVFIADHLSEVPSASLRTLTKELNAIVQRITNVMEKLS